MNRSLGIAEYLSEKKEKGKSIEKSKTPNKYQEAIEKAIKDGEEMDRLRKETNKHLLSNIYKCF